jgi:HPt (histidine-containing phosphotransfer) domain-containing protein
MESAMNQPSSKPTQSSTNSLPIEDIALDCDRILTQAGGDTELLMQLCGNFLHELPMRMDSLSTAIKANNNLAAGRALQQLRNCLVIFGSPQLSCTATVLEAAVHAQRARQAQRESKRLECQLQRLTSQVQRFMLEISAPTTPVQ